MKHRSLEEILQSTSDVLFPDQIGQAIVSIGSKDADGDTPLHVMVWRGDRDAVQQLIDAGAAVDAVGDMGETPLHVAVSRADEPIAEMLLRAGAKTDIRSEFGDTQEERAIKKGGSLSKLFQRAV